ncbi:MAG: hypothetical protein WCY10_02260 [Candidatus Omnitrophota bacterium]
MRALIVFSCMLAICLTATRAFCHSPQDMVISVSGENIDVIVTHPVSDPTSHFVKTIKVSLNGVLLIEQTFFLQSGNEQRARYNIPGLKKSESVTVAAYCSISGSLIRNSQAE